MDSAVEVVRIPHRGACIGAQGFRPHPLPLSFCRQLPIQVRDSPAITPILIRQLTSKEVRNRPLREKQASERARLRRNEPKRRRKSSRMKQLSFAKVNGWGGKRPGAGRKNRSGTLNHMRRAEVDFQKPLHISLKLKKGLPNLRTEAFRRKFVESLGAAGRFGLHVLHYAILSNHIHLIVEAPNNKCLGAGMRSLCGRISRIVRAGSNQSISGSVFVCRYFMKVVQSPRQMRALLEYVLLNKAKHQNAIEHVDSFSSGYAFRHWNQLLRRRITGLIREQIGDLKPENPLKFGLAPPRSWLARQGWMRAVR